jgi:hypothetical protein
MLKFLTAIQLLVITSALLIASSLQAGPNGYYRWTGANGTTQHADRPPEGVDAEFIKSSNHTASKKTSDDAAIDNQTSNSDSSKPVAPSNLEVVLPKDPKLCEQAKRNLNALEGARIRITEPDGSKRILTEDEKETQRKDANKFIDIHC